LERARLKELLRDSPARLLFIHKKLVLFFSRQRFTQEVSHTKNKSMKNKIIPILVLCAYILFTPGFYCNGPRNCNDYSTDTTYLPFKVSNSMPLYHVADSIKFISVISDTLHPNTGTQFIASLNRLTAGLQVYKVVNNGTIPELNYANNEFNAVLKTGSFENAYGSGYAMKYKRLQPFNTLEGSLVPGHAGLYMVTVGLGEYGASSTYGYYLNNGSDPCTTHIGECFVGTAQQQTQYWDSLGVSALSLSSASYIVAKRGDPGYFFVKVAP
jgi:hypothetical protein